MVVKQNLNFNPLNPKPSIPNPPGALTCLSFVVGGLTSILSGYIGMMVEPRNPRPEALPIFGPLCVGNSVGNSDLAGNSDVW